MIKYADESLLIGDGADYAGLCGTAAAQESYRVMAFEYFATRLEDGVLHYRFLIGKNGGEQAPEWLAMASVSDAGGRRYVLMMFAGNTSPAVFLAEYASWNTEPTYDEVRTLMIAIVQGTQKPLRGNPLTLQ